MTVTRHTLYRACVEEIIRNNKNRCALNSVKSQWNLEFCIGRVRPIILKLNDVGCPVASNRRDAEKLRLDVCRELTRYSHRGGHGFCGQIVDGEERWTHHCDYNNKTASIQFKYLSFVIWCTQI